MVLIPQIRQDLFASAHSEFRFTVKALSTFYTSKNQAPFHLNISLFNVYKDPWIKQSLQSDVKSYGMIIFFFYGKYIYLQRSN